MEHFYETIHGWTDGDLFQLYSKAVKEATDNSHFVEIGSWKGKSASYMCVEIINSGKKIKFDCVDPWTGTSDAEHGFDEDYKNKTLFETFTKNMESVKEYYNPIRMTSVEASKLYEDNSLDFVFIDGNHDYENVRNDVLAWLPKIKPGKILTGHDWSVGEVKPGVLSVLDEKEIELIGRICWIYTKK